AGVVPGSAGWVQDDDTLVIYVASMQAHAEATPQGDQRQFYMLIRDALKGQIATPVPQVEALEVMAFMEAAGRSAESGMVQR
ncbi:oxidoreductase, partial [Klebsiella pneumoniae]|nr:oxidoreductase [Klebsiella pneumoniae]